MQDEFVAGQWIECRDCGLLQILPAGLAGHSRHCCRCQSSFGRGAFANDAALALIATALILFALANLFPLMAIKVAGRGQSVHLVSAVTGLVDHDYAPLASFVFLIAILAPLAQTALLGYVLMRVRGPARDPHLALLLRIADRMRPWAMLDVFLIGALVAVTKLHDMAAVEIDVGFWALGLLVATLAVIDMTVDRHFLWDQVSPPAPLEAEPRQEAWLGCDHCGLVQKVAGHCRRCGASLQHRKPDSLNRTAALTATGYVLYLPANLYPVLTVISFGRGSSATIMGGVVELAKHDDWPLAVVVFAASVAVPLLKLLGLSWLLISAVRRRHPGLFGRTRLYRLIELVSRWSAVDIFVAALLTALVALGNLATIEPGLGVLAFGAVVFVTMLATDCFDPRLMWDAAGANDVR